MRIVDLAVMEDIMSRLGNTGTIMALSVVDHMAQNRYFSVVFAHTLQNMKQSKRNHHCQVKNFKYFKILHQNAEEIQDDP